MVFASGPGVSPPANTPTLADLLMHSGTALDCAILLLVGLLVMGLVYHTDGWRFWRRKTVQFLVAATLIALTVAQQAWSLHQSFIHDGLSPDATYADVYRRISEAAANHLDQTVGTFGMWSVALVFTTFMLLCVVAEQIVTSLRARRRASARSH